MSDTLETLHDLAKMAPTVMQRRIRECADDYAALLQHSESQAAQIKALSDRCEALQKWQDRSVKVLELAVQGLDVAASEGTGTFIGYVFAGDACRLLLSDVRPQPIKENKT